jgi:hypothetical protein
MCSTLGGREAVEQGYTYIKTVGPGENPLFKEEVTSNDE